MLYLPDPTEKILKNYINNLKKKVVKRIKKLPDIDTKPLEDILENILIDKPAKLLIHQTYIIDEILKKNINEFDDKEFQYLLSVWTNIKKSEYDINLCLKYKLAISIFECFDYDEFISKSKKTSYDLALALNRNTCTYCNRSYVNTIVVKDENTNRVNDKGRITRPQFDHWFAKSKFPFLALSFYNLIPSCSICNSSIKGDTEFDLDTHIHPYIKEVGQDFSFSYELKDLDSYKVKIKNFKPSSKIENTLKEFKIEEIYNAHAMFELKDLIDLKKKYTEDYLDMIFNESFKGIGVEEHDIYRLVFGVEKEEEDFHKRSLSKFKRDIIKELRELDK
ncbi:hypothetical protein E0494_03975 [Marinilabiliaceae bacterium JC040]|nr:hypothetical protein [Marinilabiliaceae bacterium JC040]